MASHRVIRFTELKAWLKQKGESGRAFCLRAGIEKSAGSRLLNGQFKTVDYALARKVHAATNGDVGQEQFDAFLERVARAGRRAAA